MKQEDAHCKKYKHWQLEQRKTFVCQVVLGTYPLV